MRCIGSCRYHRFSVARSSAHLCELACAERYTAVCFAGFGRLGEFADGAALCTPRCGSLLALRGSPHGVEDSGERLVARFGHTPKNKTAYPKVSRWLFGCGDRI